MGKGVKGLERKEPAFRNEMHRASVASERYIATRPRAMRFSCRQAPHQREPNQSQAPDRARPNTPPRGLGGECRLTRGAHAFEEAVSFLGAGLDIRGATPHFVTAQPSSLLGPATSRLGRLDARDVKRGEGKEPGPMCCACCGGAADSDRAQPFDRPR